ncbi:MAG: YggT family protein [Fusobacterium sp.]|nr:YggT family protein [Fusobacterium sp.]
MVSAVSKLFELYFLVIILRCFLSFFPRIDIYKQPVKFIRDITDPYLDIFRRFIPPVNGLDFSPIVAVIVLQILQVLVCSALDIVF